ncbi:MAG: GNAT family N-acetyltransferase [Ideonella sp. MAG2]|nr:MAG: GNAT family N-acetyltransferase [Ideonella sp. MAG2]
MNAKSLTSVSIRRAHQGDAASLYAIHQRSVNAFCAANYSEEHLAEWFLGRSEAIYQDSLHAGRIWLAEAGGRVLGFVEATRGEVTLLFVRPEASGQCVGQQLLEHGVRLAAAEGPGLVTVIATKNAVSFYERHGFQSVEDQYFERGDPPRRYDVVKMVCAAPLLVSALPP